MSMLYTDQEKRIYGPYDDGSGQVVFGDPHKINRTLIRLLDGDPNRWVRDHNSDDMVLQFEATNRLIAASIEAFQLTAFDKTNGGGLDEEAILKILKHFSKWMGELKKKDEPMPTGSSASDGLPTTPAQPNPGNPILQKVRNTESPAIKEAKQAEQNFMDERQKDHEALRKRMAPLTRTGLPSG